MTMYFSPSTNSFYPSELMSTYKEAGTIPSDLAELSDDDYQTALDALNADKQVFIVDGEIHYSEVRPDKYHTWDVSTNAWIITDAEKSQQVADAAAASLAKAQSEYDRATAEINALNEQIEDSDWTGTTEDAVKASLGTWTDYRKSLRAYIKAEDGTIELPSLSD